MYAIRSSATVCLVPEARRGPFVFHGDLAEAFKAIGDLGFDGIEIFPPSADSLNNDQISDLLTDNNLRLAAVGTGAGMILHGLSLSHRDRRARERACAYVRRIIDFASLFGAPAIVGSMQGRSGSGQTREQALANLMDSLRQLCVSASDRGVPVLLEPLNRYETDLVNTLQDGAEVCEKVRMGDLKLLADLFHMNIEEADIAQSIEIHAEHIGHVHFADSSRRAVGFGHTPMEPIVQALKKNGYKGFLSAEVFPYPDSRSAAHMTIGSFNRYVGWGGF